MNVVSAEPLGKGGDPLSLYRWARNQGDCDVPRMPRACRRPHSPAENPERRLAHIEPSDFEWYMAAFAPLRQPFISIQDPVPGDNRSKDVVTHDGLTLLDSLVARHLAGELVLGAITPKRTELLRLDFDTRPGHHERYRFAVEIFGEPVAVVQSSERLSPEPGTRGPGFHAFWALDGEHETDLVNVWARQRVEDAGGEVRPGGIELPWKGRRQCRLPFGLGSALLDPDTLAVAVTEPGLSIRAFLERFEDVDRLRVKARRPNARQSRSPVTHPRPAHGSDHGIPTQAVQWLRRDGLERLLVEPAPQGSRWDWQGLVTWAIAAAIVPPGRRAAEDEAEHVAAVIEEHCLRGPWSETHTRDQARLQGQRSRRYVLGAFSDWNAERRPGGTGVGALRPAALRQRCREVPADSPALHALLEAVGECVYPAEAELVCRLIVYLWELQGRPAELPLAARLLRRVVPSRQGVPPRVLHRLDEAGRVLVVRGPVPGESCTSYRISLPWGHSRKTPATRDDSPSPMNASLPPGDRSVESTSTSRTTSVGESTYEGPDTHARGEQPSTPTHPDDLQPRAAPTRTSEGGALDLHRTRGRS